MNSKFSVVMPIIQTSYLLHDTKKPTQKHNNFERFFRVGWPTLQRHIRWADVAAFFVIVRADEAEIFRSYIVRYVPDKLRKVFQLVRQEELITVKDMEKTRVQMLCKILIAERVHTHHYLIIDDDNVALRSFGFEDVFSDRSHRYVRYTHDETFHDHWFRGSAEVLQVPYETQIYPDLCRLRKQKRILSVTPEIFITNQARSLLGRIKQTHGEGYQDVMSKIKGRWSEYTLMWIHLILQGPVTDWYRGSKVRLSDNQRNVWFRASDLTESLRNMWSDPKPYFGVIQSNVPENEVDAVVNAIQTISTAH